MTTIEYNMNTDNFAPDMGVAIKNGELASLKHIVLTPTVFNGMPVRECGNKTELTVDVNGYLGTLVVPLKFSTIMNIVRTKQVLPLIITGLGKPQTSTYGEQFILVKTKLGTLPK